MHRAAESVHGAGKERAGSVQGVHTECACSVHGACIERAWSVHGACTERAWSVHRACIGWNAIGFCKKNSPTRKKVKQHKYFIFSLGTVSDLIFFFFFSHTKGNGSQLPHSKKKLHLGTNLWVNILKGPQSNSKGLYLETVPNWPKWFQLEIVGHSDQRKTKWKIFKLLKFRQITTGVHSVYNIIWFDVNTSTNIKFNYHVVQ